MPRLWNDTIEAHRTAVREATLDATAGLVAEHGLGSVTMSRVAEATGIGRATLYKYFPDLESILVAWHQRQIDRHLGQLAKIAEHIDHAGRRLQATLEAYAFMSHRHRGNEAAARLHRGEHFEQARRRLRDFVHRLLTDAVATGDVRDDVPTRELADYCVHALDAAMELSSKAAVRRLVRVTLAGLRVG